jgi:hypothetical protein
LSDDGRTWVLMVQSNDSQAMTDAVLDASRIAFDAKA